MNRDSHTANEAWAVNIAHVLAMGQCLAPRDMPTVEILNFSSRVDMRFPCITNPMRKMGYRFLAAEAYWILSGDNRVETIAPYSSHITEFSDDGYRFQGAYGPRVSEQIRYVVDSLIVDRLSRQAVISIWRESPRMSRDIPCTLSLQFFLRKNSNSLWHIHTVANMRSSDLWLGWVYDVFNFTMITSWVALRLMEITNINLELGTLYLNAGSQHLYERDEKKAAAARHGESWVYRPMDLTEFPSPGSLMLHLKALRDRDWATVAKGFFHEVQSHV